ncbi:hypothetical protein CYMTET_32011 [Cymbomonas tetramitiformis]|uniref:Uncharacterized protein n=1 Tax=Cymbomonas tetramitiformis TaxID=36881 RepID=A0AAE0FFX0_9CHLO|nr:hypothetical protein CYMTET_32011 [Cymbomonas tetramitiformis]
MHVSVCPLRWRSDQGGWGGTTSLYFTPESGYQRLPCLLGVLLLDELTTFLDSSDQRGVVEAVRRTVTSGGVTALWVTHRLEELEFADGATYLDKGRMMHTGSAASTLNYVKQLQADYHSKR